MIYNHAHNHITSQAVLLHFLQTGAFLPFFRAHAHLDTKRREPWLQPDEHAAAIRQAIIARYRLLPYWYTVFYGSSINGHPIVRPLWVELPQDPATFVVEDEFFVGKINTSNIGVTSNRAMSSNMGVSSNK